jgi:hypothetical protein
MSEERPAETRTGAEAGGDRRRFVTCAVAFAISAAVVVGIPVGVGLHGYFRARAEERLAKVLKDYGRAQTIYHGEDRDGDRKNEYCRDYTKLTEFEETVPPSEDDDDSEKPRKRKLVGEEFAAARGKEGKPYLGYVFREMRTIWNIPINWEGDYAICATPAEYGETGRKTYVMKTDGDVWSKDLGESRLLRDYPRDLEEGGWKKFGEKEKPAAR